MMERNMILITGLDYGQIHTTSSEERKLSRKPKKLYLDANRIEFVELDDDTIYLKADGIRHCLYFNDSHEQEAVFNKLMNYCK